jgi:hypothetical protein
MGDQPTLVRFRAWVVHSRMGVGTRQCLRADLGHAKHPKSYDSPTVHLRLLPIFEGICVPRTPLPIWGGKLQVITVKATFLRFGATQIRSAVR